MGDAPSGEHPRDRQSRQIACRDASQSCNAHDGLAGPLSPSAMSAAIGGCRGVDGERMKTRSARSFRVHRHARSDAHIVQAAAAGMSAFSHCAIDAPHAHRSGPWAIGTPGGSFRAGSGPPTRRQGPYPPAIFLCIKHASEPQLYLAKFCLIMYLAGILYPDICNLGGISWTGRYLKAGLNS